jgi:hypothetical protein
VVCCAAVRTVAFGPTTKSVGLLVGIAKAVGIGGQFVRAISNELQKPSDGLLFTKAVATVVGPRRARFDHEPSTASTKVVGSLERTNVQHSFCDPPALSIRRSCLFYEFLLSA